MAKANPRFKNSLSDVEGSGAPEHCFQCSACVAECPAAKKFDSFNPREIVLCALLGVEEPLLENDSVIWQCATCYKCYERCPQGAKPVEVITALKNIATERGTAPAGSAALIEAVLSTGRLLPVTDAVAKRRSELGLPPAPEAIDLKSLIEK